MATVLVLLSVLTGALALVLTILNIREKLWPKAPTPHPLDDRLRDVAIAIRELRQTWDK